MGKGSQPTQCLAVSKRLVGGSHYIINRYSVSCVLVLGFLFSPRENRTALLPPPVMTESIQHWQPQVPGDRSRGLCSSEELPPQGACGPGQMIRPTVCQARLCMLSKET